MAASALVYGEDGALRGVVAGEFGLDKDREPGPSYEPGMELRGKYVFLAEGVRGSLSKQVIARYGLAERPRAAEVRPRHEGDLGGRPARHRLGQVTHTMGWPLGDNAGGGSFMYHLENNQVFVGFVVHLNYENPWLYPYMEFQRFKHHPLIADVLKGGKRVAYGARAITEGGWQSIPKLTFPGGALLGDSAGFVNVPRIKGNHNAMLSGIAAAEAAHARHRRRTARATSSTDYAEAVETGPIARDLKPVRNVKPLWSRYGLTASLALGGLDMWINTLFGNRSPFGTLTHGKTDAEATRRAEHFAPIDYPKPDGVLSFDRLTNVAFSFTNHDENQPCHLTLKDPRIPIDINLPRFAEPAQRYCPAGVYEVVRDEDGSNPRFVINFQNCVHCKTCDIKDPLQNIVWTTPAGRRRAELPQHVTADAAAPVIRAIESAGRAA